MEFKKLLLIPAFTLTLVLLFLSNATCCTTKFDGFGVHLGSNGHFTHTSETTIRNVIDKLYFELQLRNFRTSYEPYMSPSNDTYSLECTDSAIPYCLWSWEAIHRIIGEPKYENCTFTASIWSPPHYMKNQQLVTLRREYETKYLYFIHNVTELIRTTYGINIEHISPVNEPENVFAPWDHTNMDAHQLCRMVSEFNSSLVNLCTENSYYWITQGYISYKNQALNIDCLKSCEIIATHSYALNINPTDPHFLLAYYDLVPYKPIPNKRIWQTEVSSTYHNAFDTQMIEALDLAINIVNFVGITCVERYYFWAAYTNGASGESLIWGNRITNEVTNETEYELTFPKKYYVYNHFTNASFGGDKYVKICESIDFIDETVFLKSTTTCLKFDSNTTVFVNKGLDYVIINSEKVDCSLSLCCTTNENNFACNNNETDTSLYELPPESVCTCKGIPINNPIIIPTSSSTESYSTTEEFIVETTPNSSTIVKFNVLTMLVVLLLRIY